MPTQRNQTSLADLADSDLLRKFVNSRDEAAFEEIVRRHCPLVLGVCRRVLGNTHDVEDACQATFAVLARCARKIRRRKSLSNWLYGVAYRVSMQAMKKKPLASSLPIDPISDEDNPLAQLAKRSDEEILDEELSRMPRRYRSLLVLHYLEGRTQQQLADASGLSVTAIAGRIKRGRAELRRRLLQRGITLASFVTIVSWSQRSITAEALESLVRRTVETSLLFGGGTTAGVTSHQLAESEIAEMTLASKSIVLSAAVAVIALGVGFYGVSNLIGQEPRADSKVTVPSALQPAAAAPRTGVVGLGSDGRVFGLTIEATEPEAEGGSPAINRNRMAIQRIEAKLENKVDAALFTGHTLAEFTKKLQEFLEVPVVIDTPALEDYGIGTDTPMTVLDPHEISTRSALQIALEEFDMAYVIDKEVILITTIEEAESRLDTRVYAIDDISIQIEKLVEVISNAIERDSWDKVGGPGVIEAASETRLVISQTQVVHERVVDLLQQLRRADADQNERE